MAQSPTISIPKKSTDEVDWATPIRNIIAQSYGENPDSYATECAALQRCRQDAVRGAGSDTTGRDLLYKYFGQLELLELRFSEIRVSFPWRDAFTNKLTTQTSLAFEKASIIFQIASTHSTIACSQNRSDPEGIKRAYHYFRTCAGMLTYINDNFLHAPSTDLSREVIKFLVGLTMAQAHETLFEKCLDEKKATSLVAKIGAQTAFMYTGLVEEVKEFMGKGIFDRNWVTLLQIKAKYFTSLAQYQRSLVDTAAGKHGDALARLGVAEAAAKEAHRAASSFSPYFVTTLSPTLPPDTGSAILELTKAHATLCTEKKISGHKDNDLIYNAIVPSEATLPPLEKLAVATPIPIQEVYGTPDVQKTIGPDLFAKLIPLSVHESASVYSEEKAKLVRREVEKADLIENETKAMLDTLAVKQGLGRFRDMVDGNTGDTLPREVIDLKEEIQKKEQSNSVESLMRELERHKIQVRDELEAASRDLEIESRDCEAMRVKYEHLWTQEPSAVLSKSLRQDLKSHFSALDAAAPSDRQVASLWESVLPDISSLFSSRLEEIFSTTIDGPNNLLEVDASADDEERSRIAQSVKAIDDKLGKINKISRERGEILKDLKEKIQTDDVSHLLLLNRRNTAVEPTLFANELEKFRPYQLRLEKAEQIQRMTLEELAAEWTQLKNKGSKGPSARKWEERERKRMELVKRYTRARDGWMEVREGLTKGLQFYRDLAELSSTLRKNVTSFVSARNVERETLAAQADVNYRLSAPAPQNTERPRVPPHPQGLEPSFAALNLSNDSRGATQPSQPVPSNHQRSASQVQSSLPPPPPPPPARHPSYNQPQYSSPTPVIPPNSNPYGDLFNAPGLSSQFSVTPAPPTIASPPAPPQQWPAYIPPPPAAPYSTHSSQQYSPAPAPAPAPQRQPTYPTPPAPPVQPSYQYPPYQLPHQPSSAFPPPPLPISYSQQYPASPPLQNGNLQQSQQYPQGYPQGYPQQYHQTPQGGYDYPR